MDKATDGGLINSGIYTRITLILIGLHEEHLLTVYTHHGFIKTKLRME